MGIIKGFEKLRPNALILTKFDEAASIGQIISAIKKSEIPIAYLSSGQRIPEDIEPATKEKFAEMILSDDEL